MFYSLKQGVPIFWKPQTHMYLTARLKYLPRVRYLFECLIKSEYELQQERGEIVSRDLF